MRYETNERFRDGGLRATPWWRWSLYAILFATAVGFLGKADRFLLYAAPIAALFIVLMFAGMSKALHTPHIRAWMLDNLWWIIPLFMIMQIALFVWDRIEERRNNGDRPTTKSTLSSEAAPSAAPSER